MSDVQRYSLIRAKAQPPENELPAVLAAPDVVWRGDGVVFAIPSLAIYTTGAEIEIVYRTAGDHPRTTEQALQTSDSLRNLTANGHPVALLGGEHKDHGFSYRAWISFTGSAPRDIAFALEWPGVEAGQRQVSGIAEAARRITVLW